MKKITVILQVPFAQKLKYAKTILCQLNIIYTQATDLILREAYFANALVNF